MCLCVGVEIVAILVIEKFEVIHLKAVLLRQNRLPKRIERYRLRRKNHPDRKMVSLLVNAYSVPWVS